MIPVMGVVLAAVIRDIKSPSPPGIHTFIYCPILTGNELPILVVNPYYEDSDAYRKSQVKYRMGVNIEVMIATKKHNMPNITNTTHIKYNICLHLYF